MLDAPELNVATYTVLTALDTLRNSDAHQGLVKSLIKTIDELATEMAAKTVTRFPDAYTPADLTAALSKRYRLLKQVMDGSRKTLISEVMQKS